MEDLKLFFLNQYPDHVCWMNLNYPLVSLVIICLLATAMVVIVPFNLYLGSSNIIVRPVQFGENMQYKDMTYQYLNANIGK